MMLRWWHEGVWGETVVYPDYGGGHMNLYMC